VALHHGTRAGVQVAGARVVTRPPTRHHVRDRGPRQRTHVGEALDEAPEIRQRGGDLGLLQHDSLIQTAVRDHARPARAGHAARGRGTTRAAAGRTRLARQPGCERVQISARRKEGSPWPFASVRGDSAAGPAGPTTAGQSAPKSSSARPGAPAHPAARLQHGRCAHRAIPAHRVSATTASVPFSVAGAARAPASRAGAAANGSRPRWSRSAAERSCGIGRPRSRRAFDQRPFVAREHRDGSEVAFVGRFDPVDLGQVRVQREGHRRRHAPAGFLREAVLHAPSTIVRSRPATRWRRRNHLAQPAKYS